MKALHLQAEDFLMERIHSGQWPPGTQIPPETELAAELGVSRPTIRQAMARLVSNGYLVRIKGRGSFVKQSKLLHRSTSMLSSYRMESERQGLRISTQVLCLKTEYAKEDAMRSLNLTGKAKVSVLTRLRRINGYNGDRPVVLTTVHVPFNRFPELQDMDFTQISLYEALEQKGLYVKHASRELEAIMPQPEIAELLQISQFEPVLLIRSIGKLSDGTPIEYSESYYPAGCSKFQIETDR